MTLPTPETLAERLALARSIAAEAGNTPVACLFDDALARIRELEGALGEIRDAHIPDQPAAAGGDELAWAQQHVAKLRNIARTVLNLPRGGGDGTE